MQRDPKKVVDATKENRVDWDREVERGNLTQVTGLARDTSDPTFRHVQGRPLNDEEARRRIVPAGLMQHVAETGRYPHSSTKVMLIGGWPKFDADGNIVHEEKKE